MAMAGKRKNLGEILMNHKIITQAQLDTALADQRTAPRPLGQILIQRGYLTEKLLLQALAAQKGVGAWHIDQDPADPAAVAKIDPLVCRDNYFLPVGIKGQVLVVAMKDPDDIQAIDLLRNLSGMRIEPVMADEVKLAKAIKKLAAVAEIETSQKGAKDVLVQQALDTYGGTVDSLTKIEKAELDQVDTRPVVGLCNQIVLESISNGASDIHIEPMDERIDVRLRIDGQLVDMMKIPAKLGPMLTTRLKIMSGIDIVESRVPQDGRITAEMNGREVDLRVSVLPSYHGPRIVMRILDQSGNLRNLNQLGFYPSNLELFRKLIDRPYGFFIVTGPTGSGKTTTLYSAINELRTGRNNIMTCEDPVEYLLDGVNQSQVNERVGLTFGIQLRAILRQDPDVVLVGEIRDHETAETALRASMTGHMVLSTLHTNDAPSAIPRLLDMDVNPFLLSTSLVGVLSQRLLRVLCPACKAQGKPSESESEFMRTVFGREDVDSLFHAVGCPECFETGYKGRIGVHEIMPVTPQISKMIAELRPIETIREEASFYGYRTIQEDACWRVLNGDTSLEEARRQISFNTVIREDAGDTSFLRAA